MKPCNPSHTICSEFKVYLVKCQQPSFDNGQNPILIIRRSRMYVVNFTLSIKRKPLAIPWAVDLGQLPLHHEQQVPVHVVLLLQLRQCAAPTRRPTVPPCAILPHIPGSGLRKLATVPYTVPSWLLHISPGELATANSASKTGANFTYERVKDRTTHRTAGNKHLHVFAGSRSKDGATVGIK